MELYSKVLDNVGTYNQQKEMFVRYYRFMM